MKPKDAPTNEYARDLVEQIHDINSGTFLEGTDLNSTFNFCTGVAGYPEKHFSSPNLKEDIKHLKAKIDAGAEYITTQMFFNNQSFYDFQSHCLEAGINVPIIPGIKIITSIKQLTNIPKRFYIDLPDTLVDEIMNNPKHVKEIGQRWALQQSEDLLNSGVPLIHYYVMNSPETVTEIVHKLQK
jgi:methylenetetrahydrofolate reductase (NADPH)